MGIINMNSSIPLQHPDVDSKGELPQVLASLYDNLYDPTFLPKAEKAVLGNWVEKKKFDLEFDPELHRELPNGKSIGVLGYPSGDLPIVATERATQHLDNNAHV